MVGSEPHIGVLLGNVLEYPLWLSAAALAGAAVADINPTRRGPELARDVTHTDCALLITERAHVPLLDGLGLPIPRERVPVVDAPAYQELIKHYEGVLPGKIAAARAPTPTSRMLLYFTYVGRPCSICSPPRPTPTTATTLCVRGSAPRRAPSTPPALSLISSIV